MTIHKLDLDGTACYESREGVSIALDGTASNDDVVHRIVGDHNHMPFAADTFDEAYGSCYLEETVDLSELLRVMRPGALLQLGSCGMIDCHILAYGTPADAGAYGYSIDPQSWLDDVLTFVGQLQTAGFEVRKVECRSSDVGPAADPPICAVRRTMVRGTQAAVRQESTMNEKLHALLTAFLEKVVTGHESIIELRVYSDDDPKYRMIELCQMADGSYEVEDEQ